MIFLITSGELIYLVAMAVWILPACVWFGALRATSGEPLWEDILLALGWPVWMTLRLVRRVIRR